MFNKSGFVRSPHLYDIIMIIALNDGGPEAAPPVAGFQGRQLLPYSVFGHTIILFSGSVFITTKYTFSFQKSEFYPIKDFDRTIEILRSDSVHTTLKLL